MNLHEYQAKQLFGRYGIPTPEGLVAVTVDEAIAAARKFGGDRWVVKAQVHAGGRGKAGGVRLVEGQDELASYVDQLLGSKLVTGQSAGRGLPVQSVLIERPVEIDKEYYLGILLDRSRRRLVVMASAAGGMAIEEVAARDPEAILQIAIDPVAGFQAYQGRQLAFGLGLQGSAVGQLAAMARSLEALVQGSDASLVEINPLVTTASGDLLALDAKINIDDSALYRQQQIAAERDSSQEDEREYAAQQHGLNYIGLDGNIACMVNGAGLAMATMDIIQLYGGKPANFLDVGGGTTADKVAEAFKLILSDSHVRAILVNVFGGIVRCDLIAEGIIQAVREIEISVPVVARLEGTNAEAGREMLAASGLNILAASELAEAAQRVVEVAGVATDGGRTGQ
jgi:succinyl-CoA synthetase beta subunit